MEVQQFAAPQTKPRQADSQFADTDLSVVICAHTEKRWDDLAAAIACVRAQSVQPREIVVVIDHNPALLARTRQAFPDVRVIENTEPAGASGSKNTGFAMSLCPLIAFLDDDAVAEPDWLERMVRLCADPDVMGAGSWVVPRWPASRPRWVPDEFLWAYGCSYRGLPVRTAPVRNLFANSMCIRRDVYTAIGGFHYDIGPGTRLDGIRQMLSCEETEFCIRARQKFPKRRFMLDPEARATHRVPPEKTGWTYFYDRCYGEGLSKAVVAKLVGPTDGLAEERKHAMLTLPKGVLRELRDAVVKLDPAGVVRAATIVAGLAIVSMGFLRGKIAVK